MPGHSGGEDFTNRQGLRDNRLPSVLFPRGKEHDGGASEVVHAQDQGDSAAEGRGGDERSADRRRHWFIALDGAGVTSVPNHGFVVRIRGLVTRDRTVTDQQASEYVANIEEQWNTSGSYHGVRYTVVTDLDYRGLPTMSNGSTGDFQLTRCSYCDPRDVRGMATPETGLMQRSGFEFSGTEAHEFGHLLGLGHRTMATDSIMTTHHPQRRVTPGDAARLVDLYGD